jgi:predicted HNH restriction endonuclease
MSYSSPTTSNTVIMKPIESMWVQNIMVALLNIGGKGSLSEINLEIKESSTRTLPRTWKNIIREKIQRQSSDSDSFQGGHDVFESVDGIGKGNWALRKEYFTLANQYKNEPNRGLGFSDQEITILTFVAKFGIHEFPDISSLKKLYKHLSDSFGRSAGSVRMKILNIASMMDDRGVARETEFAGLTGVSEGKKPRTTDWDRVENILRIPKQELLQECILILSESSDRPISYTGKFIEGKVSRSESKRYERNLKAREACIDHYGTRCQICGFDFGQQYGDLGEGFIHVHHIVPLHEKAGHTGKEYEVDPEVDLKPVCPNCHSMIHRGNLTRSMDEINVKFRFDDHTG